ncbi:hypothetical protein ACHELS_004180 [Vibrio vulnificus]|uniref:hypothetical protein n=1 Tax=Vibrio TaxID=662 RepID=UPI001593D7FE|nr:hypothetical protein [Vibrio sp. 05-20-BW147]ELK8511185.1 hypothetical protein [Vibrio vulnificus]ELK8997823.1 hypothetical protein [Vibrio vulnificus]ELS3558065.1 hypothetical protein [Vibrio vulnificus]NVC65422.1 hypothetical protein [Vibrio sp. 05-20-BW147]HDY7777643.1 hypothetical protein [Vibrio vulnificus]
MRKLALFTILCAYSFGLLAQEKNDMYEAIVSKWEELGYKSRREASIAYQASFRACYEEMSVSFPSENNTEVCRQKAAQIVSKIASYENSGSDIYH